MWHQVHHTIKRIILHEGAMIEAPILDLKAEDIHQKWVSLGVGASRRTRAPM